MIPDDVEEVLKIPPPLRPKMEKKTWRDRWMPIAGWGVAIVIALLAWRTETKPKPERVITPVVHRELQVSEPKAISATETLRVITMPSDLDYFGTKCLLHTNTQTGFSALACGKEEITSTSD